MLPRLSTGLLASLSVGIVAFLFCAPASAQVTGSIAGTIRDQTGGVLPGATVTVKGPSLQRESVSVTTSADGAYRVPLIPPGVYDVSVDASGFNSETRRSIEVAINQQTTLDFVMIVGLI